MDTKKIPDRKPDGYFPLTGKVNAPCWLEGDTFFVEVSLVDGNAIGMALKVKKDDKLREILTDKEGWFTTNYEVVNLLGEQILNGIAGHFVVGDKNVRK